MTEEELTPLLDKFGLLPNSGATVARPHLSKAERRQLARVKRAHRDELTAAKIMRTDVLNLTRGVARPRIIEELVSEGHTEAAYLLTFNDEQLALILAWRDLRVQAGASSQGKRKTGTKAGKHGSSSQGAPDRVTADGQDGADAAPARRRRSAAASGAVRSRKPSGAQRQA